jgi:hypothetical protein
MNTSDVKHPFYAVELLLQDVAIANYLTNTIIIHPRNRNIIQKNRVNIRHGRDIERP